jgi:rhodanese-related sulfurtransferase
MSFIARRAELRHKVRYDPPPDDKTKKENTMSSSVNDMLAAANSSVPTISPQDAKALIERGQVLVVDVRDGLELQSTGKVQGAKHVSRGMLEFKADPASPYYDNAFDPEKTVIVYCASGGRSALAGKTLQDMGYKDVRNLGGFKGWAESGGAVEKV